MAKATVSAAANIAFIKYWGARDLERAIPFNPSISMTLSECRSLTTVEFSEGEVGDEVLLATAEGDLAPAPPAFADRIAAHLERLRRVAGAAGAFRVATRNSFPAAAGLASSASGFAALTVAALRALAPHLAETPSPRRISELARLSGSGSAARSVFGGFVEWPAEGGDFAAFPLAGAGHWALADVVALVETGAKEVSSLEGHRRAASSPHFARRLEELPGRLERVRRAVAERDLELLGEVLEEDAIELHLVAMSSRPPIFYWKPGTLRVLEEVRALRRRGLAAYATMDAGANVHVICAEVDAAAVAGELARLPEVVGVLLDRVGEGPREHQEGLF